MSHTLTVALLYSMIGLVSLLMYDAKKIQAAGDANRPPMNSVSTFRYVYRISQLTFLYVLVLFFMGRHELTVSLFHNLATLYAGAWISVAGIVLFIGAKDVITLPLLIYDKAIQQFDYTTACVIAVVNVALSLALYSLYRFVVARFGGQSAGVV